MKRISHIKIIKHLGVLHLVQRVISIGNGIIASNYEVINSRTIITKRTEGGVCGGTWSSWEESFGDGEGRLDQGSTKALNPVWGDEEYRAGLTSPQLTQPSMGRRLCQPETRSESLDGLWILGGPQPRVGSVIARNHGTTGRMINDKDRNCGRTLWD